MDLIYESNYLIQKWLGVSKKRKGKKGRERKGRKGKEGKGRGRKKRKGKGGNEIQNGEIARSGDRS